MKLTIRRSSKVNASSTAQPGHEFNIQYFQVFKNPGDPTSNGKMIAQAGTIEEANAKGIKLVGEGNYFLKAVCDDGQVRYIDNDYVQSSINCTIDSEDEEYNPYSFMVGDQLEWSGQHGGNYRGIVTKVTDEYITVDFMLTSEGSGSTSIESRKFSIKTDPHGKECIIVWTHRGDAGYVYPPAEDDAVLGSVESSQFNQRPKIRPLSLQCPVCHTLAAHSTEKDIYYLADIDHGELFVCDECGSEMFARLRADGHVVFDVHTAPDGTDWDAINSASESQKTGDQWIRDRLEEAAIEHLTKNGFDAEDIAWMLHIDVNKSDTEMRFEVRCELSYNSMRALASVLDPIVQEYDPDAYFDDVDSGIIEAYVRNLGAVTSAYAVDNSQFEFSRIDRSGTDEEVALAAIMYNLGATMDEAREIYPTLSADKIQEYIEYYHLRDLPRDERLRIWDNRKKNVSSASYGGAFDIEDNQYLTKDEIVEFGNTVCDHLNETFYDTYDVSDVYMETPKKLVLTVVQKSDESEFTATIDIDMRKIRKPSDLMNRYVGDVVYALQQDIKAYNDEIKSATDITSARKTAVEWIKTKVWDAIVAKLEDDGWEPDDISDYVFVEVSRESNGIRVEVRAELSYEGLEELIERIDPIVQEYNPDAHFEPVQPGIAEAYIHWFSDITSDTHYSDNDVAPYGYRHVKQLLNGKAPDYWWNLSEIEMDFGDGQKLADNLIRKGVPVVYDEISETWCVIGKYHWTDAYFYPNPYDHEDEINNCTKDVGHIAVQGGSIFDPPDPPEEAPIEELADTEESLEISLDDVVVIIDDEGNWEYEDDSYEWTMPKNQLLGMDEEVWYSDMYPELELADCISIVESLDLIIETSLPGAKGRYKMKGSAKLVYNITDVQADDDDNIYLDYASVSFVSEKSSVDVTFEEL